MQCNRRYVEDLGFIKEKDGWTQELECAGTVALRSG